MNENMAEYIENREMFLVLLAKKIEKVYNRKSGYCIKIHFIGGKYVQRGRQDSTPHAWCWSS